MIERIISHSSQENSQAERIIRSLFDMARCMLYYAGAPIVFWREALHFAAFVHNRTLSKSNINSTPNELWHGNKPDFSKMRIFGCAAHAIIPKEQRHKLSDKAVECIFVGYCTNSSGYVLYGPTTNSIFERRDVYFNEEKFPFQLMPRSNPLFNLEVEDARRNVRPRWL